MKLLTLMTRKVTWEKLVVLTLVKSSMKDMSKVLDELLQMNVFKNVPGRKHKTFYKLQPNLIKTLDEDKPKEWMSQHFAEQYYSRVHV